MLGQRLQGVSNANYLGSSSSQSPNQSITSAIYAMQGSEELAKGRMMLIIGNMTNTDALRYGFAGLAEFAQAQQIVFTLKTQYLQRGEGSEEDFNRLLVSLPEFKQVVSMISAKQLSGLGYTPPDMTGMAITASQLNEQEQARKRAANAELIKAVGGNMADILTAGSKADIANAEASRANYELQAQQLRAGVGTGAGTGAGGGKTDDGKIWGLPKIAVYAGGAALGIGLLYGLITVLSDDKPQPQAAAPANPAKQLSGFGGKKIKKTTKKGVKKYTI